MTHLGLFEGIGGFSLAARWMGWQTVAWCEWNEFGQKVLRHHFPEAEGHGDITKTDFTKYANTIDILTGGFPCQDISVCGSGIGIGGGGSGLWSEQFRAAKETNCRYLVAENSPQLLSKGFEKILLDLSEIGYVCEWRVLPASWVGAYHERERIWIVAYPDRHGFKGILSGLSEGSSLLPKPSNKIIIPSLPESYDQLGDHQRIRISNGVPNQLDRIKACGNAIVPQVAYEIFKAIEKYENP